MPWVRVDDRYPDNRKVKGLSDAAFRLDVEAICWAAANLTDGAIVPADLPLIGRRGTRRYAAELVARGRWHPAGSEPCGSKHCPPPGPDGFVIHDYWQYQPSREKVEREREAKADRQAKWLAARKNGSVDKHVDNPAKDASSDVTRDASQAAPETVTPSPPRPAPKEGGSGGSRSTPARRQAAERGGGGEQRRDGKSPICRDCGNRTNSPYHRNVCTKTQLTTGDRP